MGSRYSKSLIYTPKDQTSSNNVIRIRPNMRIAQNMSLIWLDSNIDQKHNACQNTITHLRTLMNTVNTFTNEEECIRFLEKIKEDKVCMIISGSFSKHIVHCAHDMSHVNSIFIICDNEQYYEQWTKYWPKIKGVYKDIKVIYDAVKHSVDNYEQNIAGFSLVTTSSDTSSKENLNQLDTMFMYSQILKEILLQIEFKPKHLLDFTNYCREIFTKDSTHQICKVNIFERDYRKRTPIWWYTSELFLYTILNRALRLFDIDIIVKIGFFICDLYQQINKLHQQQFIDKNIKEIFTVYRGQRISIDEFEKVSKNKNGLISFNHFLSTSTNKNVSMSFASCDFNDLITVGVLFEMKIDPQQSTTPFASVADVGAYNDQENEILFAMHTVFRIRNIKQIDENTRLFLVETELTSDDDEDLQILTRNIREETFSYEEGWSRLGLVLRRMGKSKQEEEVYHIILQQITDEIEKVWLYNKLGNCKQEQTEYKEAIEFYKKSMKIYEKYFPKNDSLVSCYNNIGNLCFNIGEYNLALYAHEKALKIRLQLLPTNQLDLASSYNNIGLVYRNMGDIDNAFSFHQQALIIREQFLPSNHPDLAGTYINIGNVYFSMNEHVTALFYYEKALVIQQQSLPSNHPCLASTYYNIGMIHKNVNEYIKAILYYEKALAIRQQSLPHNHSDLIACYSSIGLMYDNIGEHDKALSYYEQVFSIQK